jgi:hypothetical protein
MTKNFTLAELTKRKQAFLTHFPNHLRETFVRLQKTSYSQREMP